MTGLLPKHRSVAGTIRHLHRRAIPGTHQQTSPQGPRHLGTSRAQPMKQQPERRLTQTGMPLLPRRRRRHLHPRPAPTPRQLLKHTNRRHLRARRLSIRRFPNQGTMMCYGHSRGRRGVADREVPGPVPAPGRAAAAVGRRGRGPVAGSWRDPGGGPGCRDAGGHGIGRGGGVGVRRGSAGPGPAGGRWP
jgi:hypothetical protein